MAKKSQPSNPAAKADGEEKNGDRIKALPRVSIKEVQSLLEMKDEKGREVDEDTVRMLLDASRHKDDPRSMRILVTYLRDKKGIVRCRRRTFIRRVHKLFGVTPSILRYYQPLAEFPEETFLELYALGRPAPLSKYRGQKRPLTRSMLVEIAKAKVEGRTKKEKWQKRVGWGRKAFKNEFTIRDLRNALEGYAASAERLHSIIVTLGNEYEKVKTDKKFKRIPFNEALKEVFEASTKAPGSVSNIQSLLKSISPYCKRKKNRQQKNRQQKYRSPQRRSTSTNEC